MVLRDPSGPTTIGHVLLTFSVIKEDGGVFTAECPELGVPSFGKSLESALDNVIDATIVYLNAIEDRGQRPRIFDERQVTLVDGHPLADIEGTDVKLKSGE